MTLPLRPILRAAVLVATLVAAPFGLSAQPAPPSRAEATAQRAESAMPEMAPQGGQQMGGMHSMGGMQPMTCSCPSAFRGVGGLVLLALGALIAGSTAAALIALTVFLVRRSRRAAT